MAIDSIAALIKQARKDQSQAEFASVLGVSQSALCRYELGKSNPKAGVIEHCMRLVHLGSPQAEPSVEDLVDKIRRYLGRSDQAQLRTALSKLIDGFAISGSHGEPNLTENGG